MVTVRLRTAASAVAAASSGTSIAIARPRMTSPLPARLANAAAIAPAATKQTIAISGARQMRLRRPGDPEPQKDHVARLHGDEAFPPAGAQRNIDNRARRRIRRRNDDGRPLAARRSHRLCPSVTAP
jgi:hypothetical protein